MKKIKIGRAALRVATAQVRNAMLDVLPACENASVATDTVFYHEASKKEKRLYAFRRIRRQAVAILLTLVFGFSCLLALRTDVRAAVIAWFKEVFGSQGTYYFQGEPSNELPECELTWLPEGMELVQIDDIGTHKAYLYLDMAQPENGFVFACWQVGSSAPIGVHGLTESFAYETVTINGYPGELYYDTKNEENSVLLWSEENPNVVFAISCALENDVILHIAHSLVLSDSTK